MLGMKSAYGSLPYKSTTKWPEELQANTQKKLELVRQWLKERREKRLNTIDAAVAIGLEASEHETLKRWCTEVKKKGLISADETALGRVFGGSNDPSKIARRLSNKKYYEKKTRRVYKERERSGTLITVPINEAPTEIIHPDPQQTGKLTIVVMSGEANAILGAAMRALKGL